MQNWDDLRVFLSTARAGTSRAAAKHLGINQSTVLRRIQRLEERAGTRLFDRQPSGLVLTDSGAELVGLAVVIEDNIAAVDRRLQGRDTSLEGAIRLSMPDMMVGPTAPHLARFSEQYPRIEIDAFVDNDVVSLNHREADLVLRLGPSPPDELLGRRISPVPFAIYGSHDYLDGRDEHADPSSLDWVRWEESARDFPAERWIDSHVAPEQVRSRINTSLAHSELVAAGIGVGLQACYVGGADVRVRRLGGTIDFGLVLWLLTHADLMQTARVRALLRFLGDALTAERARFLG